jgi:two-component system invasion response regulator UvrY
MLQLIDGSRVSEIAARMNISPKTVSTYRARIFEKLGVTSNVELARYCQLNHVSGEK